MAKNGKLVLDLVDGYGKRLQEAVDIELRHRVLSDRRLAKRADARRRLRISRLHANPKGLYRLFIDAPSYLPVGRFVDIQASGDTLLEVPFAVDPRKIQSVAFPAYAQLESDVQELFEHSGNVLLFAGKRGERLFKALDDIRKAGFLNIVAKAKATGLPNGTAVFDHLGELLELRGDRFFAVVSHELREEIKNATAERIFDEVSGSLHHPPEAFDLAGSFKTDDRYGNLQVTFFARGTEWRADIDIDDASGLEHVFQVVRNAFAGPTHPYHIHEILLLHQQLDPGYSFVL